jgi:hypothetical protein
VKHKTEQWEMIVTSIAGRMEKTWLKYIFSGGALCLSTTDDELLFVLGANDPVLICEEMRGSNISSCSFDV